jgi:phage terminase small subunit
MSKAPTTIETPLSLLESRFVPEYLVDGNGTQAAYRAGYTGTQQGVATQASRLLRRPNVAHAIQVAEAERAEALVAERDAQSPSSVVPQLWILDKLRENVERAMQVRPVLNRDGEHTGEYSYQGAVANKALELLGRAVRLFADDDGAQAHGPVLNIERVEIRLDHGKGPPVLDGASHDADDPAQ